MHRFAKWTISLLFGITALLVACGTSETPSPTPCPEVECPTCPPEVTCPECPEVECAEPPTVVSENMYYETLWASSAHNNAESEAFRHWDGDDPQEIPAACAKCHSTPGYLDFVGVDGTGAGTMDNAVEIGTTITCIVCHNEATAQMTSVTFPSGLKVTGLGDEARCMQCHQGRASTSSVDDAIAAAELADDDTVSEELGFVNIHYSAAAATQMGAWAMGGYQYEDKSYDARFVHVEGFNACTDCHDPHTLELKMEGCGACHQGVDERGDLKRIRAAEGSQGNYDGDRKSDEGEYLTLLKSMTKITNLLHLEPTGDGEKIHLTYDLSLKEDYDSKELISKLSKLEGIEEVVLISSKSDIDY